VDKHIHGIFLYHGELLQFVRSFIAMDNSHPSFDARICFHQFLGFTGSMKRICTMQKLKTYMLMVLLLLSMISTAHAQISISVGTNRTSGNAPLAVNFDASATTAEGVSKPFHNLSYTWDFGDPGAGNWELTTGRDKNKTTGPFVGHVYDEPGNYTATLTVTDFNGHTSSHSINITVSQFSNSIYFSASGDFSGAPEGAQTVTTSNFNEAVGYASENTQLLFRRGDTFSSSSTISLNVANTMVGAFGTGSKPKVSANHGNRLISVSASDVRIVGLHFDCSQQNNLLEPSGWINNFLFYKNYTSPGKFHSGITFASSAAEYWGHDIWEDIFFVENDLQDYGFGSGGNIMFFSIDKVTVLGNHLEDAVGGEHIIRAVQIQRGIISNNILSNCRNQKHPLTIRALDNSESFYVVVSDNIVESPDDWAIQAVAKNNDLHTVYGHDLIFERNYITQIHGRAGVQVGIHLSYATDVTVRNNIFNMDGWEGARAVDHVPNTFVYNNTAYTSNATNVSFVDGEATLINNLVYVPNGSVSWNGSSNSNNIEATTNPFVSTTFDGPEDFALHNESQAINAGTNVTVKYDFNFADRPVSGLFDAGAYEYGGVIADYLNLSPNSLHFQSTGGSQEVTVSSNVSWTASDDQSWISISPSNGSNNGSITVTVDEHAETETRTGELTLTDGSIVKTIEIIQDGLNTNTGVTATLVWEDDYDGINWLDGNNDGVNEWHSYNENTAGADWSIINKSQAELEGVDITGVLGDKLYKGEITATSPSSHRAYPLTHLDDEGYGEQPEFTEGIPSPMVNQWYVWWDPENIDLDGKWMHFATWSNNPDWNVNTLTVIDGGTEPYILDIQSGDKLKQVQYHANRAVPTKQWIRFTVYIDYGYENGGGTDNDGIMAVWMNGTLIATGTGNHLDPDNIATGSPYLKRAHWGLYASGNCDRGIWYEDENKIWNLYSPLTNFDIEPMPSAKDTSSPTGLSHVQQNPFLTNELAINLEGYTNALVTIVDINGKTLLKKNVYQNELKLNQSMFSPGVYLVRIVSDKRVYDQTIIIK